MTSVTVTDPWDALVQRFDDFVTKPCLRGAGPDMDREIAVKIRKKVKAQLNEAQSKALLPANPSQLTQLHVDALKTLKTAGKGPKHTALWNGLWRAIVFDRDNYTCYFCHRSGEDGVEIPNCGHLALRLQPDHIIPRSNGGGDFELSNIRTACRLCNHGRFHLSEEHFRAELLSLAKSVWSRYGDKP